MSIGLDDLGEIDPQLAYVALLTKSRQRIEMSPASEGFLKLCLQIVRQAVRRL
ncbi:MAG: hypothetical protein ACLFVU_03770 [Phycisphaerae bacterium]